MSDWQERSNKRKKFRQSKDGPEIPAKIGKRKRAKKRFVLMARCVKSRPKIVFSRIEDGSDFELKKYHTKEQAQEGMRGQHYFCPPDYYLWIEEL